MPTAYAWLVFARWQKEFVWVSRGSSLACGAWYKKRRNMFHEYFQAEVIPNYNRTLIGSAHTLLHNISLTPENLLQHLRRRRLADQALAGVSLSANFGTYAVDYIPLLKYIPAWFPGAQFKKDGLKWRKLSLEMWNRPFDMVKARMTAGTVEPCMATSELEQVFQMASPDAADTETLIKNVSATAYAAGSDTTMSILLSFFFAMVLYPEVQERAFAEISAVVPDDRLPSFEDRARLPECLRWNPVANISLAHYLTEDDVYRGWQIPKGTTVLADIWAMLHDPSRCPDPLAFNPDRFSNEQQVAGRNPLSHLAFGFGRRSDTLSYHFISDSLLLWDLSRPLP
ncbi:cytochrome P450 [Mycena pura]|uniref:Cytochrome P450 n=1 Tax=Mycena pura TaxID=153505 RepID=A0AAD7E2Q8_9AGAR|nr:cytochrome P450 [Mycena pura]